MGPVYYSHAPAFRSRYWYRVSLPSAVRSSRARNADDLASRSVTPEGRRLRTIRILR